MIFFLLIDGIGDVSYKDLDFKTPLEYAKTPTFDYLARTFRFVF
jgi:2,3-bisphosphoglycerate-independent phosphoglycerate mutase